MIGGYEQLVIGPEGGHMEAQNVAVVVPPGAFDEEHVCAILPQPEPLPLEPQMDGSTLVYHDNIMCVGPIVLELNVDGYLRVCYPDCCYPKGLDEDDLVLLEWDDAAQLMRVVPDAIQDVDGNCFEDVTYDHFGHVAIGVRIPGDQPDQFDLVFWGEPAGKEMQGVAQGRIATPALVLMDLDGALPDTQVPGTDSVRVYLGNGDGSRVLYTTPQFEDKFEQTALRTFDVPSLADREVLPPFTFDAGNPLFGWLGFTDTIYFDKVSIQSEGGSGFSNGVATVPGGGGAPTDLYPYSDNHFLEDVRISPDGSMAILRFFVFDGKFFGEQIDVIDVFGNLLAGDLDVDIDFGDVTPRWLPDSSGIYFVNDDLVSVDRIDPDGTDRSLLYSLTALDSFFVDFVVCHPTDEPQRCAFVRRVSGIVSEAGLQGPVNGDFFDTDDLAGGNVDTFNLQGFYSVTDMRPLFSAGWGTTLVAVQLETNSDQVVTQGGGFPNNQNPTTLFFSFDSLLWAEIPEPLAHIDLARGDFGGHILAWITQTDTETFPEYPVPGIYHLDPFVGNPVLVTEGWFVDGPPRWLRSWRHAPGFDWFFGIR